MKNLLSLFILSIIPLISSAQNEWSEGFIINNQSDTIKGYLENNNSTSNSNVCYFRKDLNADVIKYTPEDIQSFNYNDGKYFISKEVNLLNIESLESGKKEYTKKRVFLEYLIQGKICIYHYYENGNGDIYFAEKDGVITELLNTLKSTDIHDKDYNVERKEYIGILNYLMQDANIQSDLEQIPLEPKPLVKIAKEYHDKVCPNETCIIYARRRNPFYVNMGVGLGASLNKYNFGNVVSTNWGLGSCLSAKFNFKNIFDFHESSDIEVDIQLQTGNNYKFGLDNLTTAALDKYNVSYIVNGNTIVYGGPNEMVSSGDYILGRDLKKINNAKVNLKLLELKIPILYNYTFTTGKIQPYAGIGILGKMVLSQNEEFKYIWFYTTYGQSIPSFHLGIVGQFGVKYKISNKRYYFTELRYEYTRNWNTNEMLQLRDNLISLSIGYSFDLLK